MRLMERCPHCGKKLLPDPRYIYTFRKWGTPALLILISLMLLLLDLLLDGKFNEWALEWAHWAVLGIWTLYVPVQLLRLNPNYGWLIVPFAGILFSLFFFYLDKLRGENTGFLGIDWAWSVIIPIITFIVAFPIVSHYARKELTHIDQLEYMVETLSREGENS